jgi:hypothetical protein
MEASGQLHVQVAFLPAKESLYPLDGRPSGPQSQSGRCGEKKKSFSWSYQESNLGRPARSLVTVFLTELSYFTYYHLRILNDYASTEIVHIVMVFRINYIDKLYYFYSIINYILYVYITSFPFYLTVFLFCTCSF